LVFDERRYEGEGENRKVVFDPLTELMAHYSGKKKEEKESKAVAGTIEERLKNRIIDGNKVGINADLDEALKKFPPLEIINTVLLDGMKTVGSFVRFGTDAAAVCSSVGRSDEVGSRVPRAVDGEECREPERDHGHCHRERRCARHRQEFSRYYSDE
jgi:hypothetical protein